MSSGNGGGGGNGNDAAAMDALNLDDLFLGGGDDAAAGGGGGADLMGDSLFGDMDIDLGDIMDGIMDNGGGGGGGGAGGGSSVGGSSKAGGGFGGSIEDIDMSGRSSTPLLDVGGSSAPSRGKKNRTARSNPFLAAAQKEKERMASKSKHAAMTTEAKSLLASVHDQILPKEAKRKRRKSKRVLDDDDDFVPDGDREASVSSSSILPGKTKRSKRGSSAGGRRSKSQVLATEGEGGSGGSPSVEGRARSSSPTLHPQHPPSSGTSVEDAERARQQAVRKAQSSVSNFGLQPSTSRFFPYMSHLPVEVDPKKRPKKEFPLLEKLNSLATVGSATSGSPDAAPLDTTAAVYKLFADHLGGLTDGHNKEGPPAALQSALGHAVQTAGTLVAAKKQTAKKHDKPPKGRGHVVDELGKLYLGCMKQSSFLRQNLWNMERWCTSHFSKSDNKSMGNVKRQDVEWVMRLLQKEREGRIQKEERARRHRLTAKRKLVNYDKAALVAPEGPRDVHTHGGPHAAPAISLKVRIKSAGGWRDKSGAKLVARLWCPRGWKDALRRADGAWEGTTMAEGSASGASASVSVARNAPTQLDLSTVHEKTLEAVASELVRPELRPEKKPPPAPKAAAASSATTTAKSSATLPSAVGTASAAGKEAADEKKKASRKRKAKESASTSAAAAASFPAAAVVPKRQKPLIVPHVPNRAEPRFPPAALAPASTDAGGGGKSSAAAEKDDPDAGAQRRRLLRFLYKQVFHPSLSPTERRQLLANEISSTLQRLEGTRAARQGPKRREIQKQVEALREAYLEDMDVVPEACNSTGMWNWIKENNYLGDVEKVEDVTDGLEGCWQPELSGECVEEEGGCWGSLPPVNVIANEDDENAIISDDSTGQGQTPSPLFDRLQSLLVEEDGESDDKDDDDLIASLPSFSPEEFIHGPNHDMADVPPSDAGDDAMLDVSALSLDQRTYIQLRAAGLVGSKALPPQLQTRLSDNNDASSPNKEESIDAILPEMKSQLSSLIVENNANVAALQRKALLHVANAPQKQRPHDPDATLSRYRQLLKTQREQREEKQKTIVRTSGRVKTGSNKFDGEQWLPW